MTLSNKISNHNFYTFLWHATFLAFAQNFIDVDTVIPSMIIESGGNAMHIGILTAIMLGGSSFTQLFFAPYLSNKLFKKKYLLLAINLRVLALVGLGFILFILNNQQSSFTLWAIFLFITLFSLSGAFANISYTDILGKSINQDKRKIFFSTRQIAAGIVVFSSAFLAKKVLMLHDFPVNYTFMFIIGAAGLLIASAGFWNIKESVPSAMKISGIGEFLTVLKKELQQNKKLGYFLGYINTQGIAISFLPFVILYAKEIIQTQNSDTGLFLQFKIIGIVFISMLVLLASKKLKYNWILYLNALLSVFISIAVLNIQDVNQLKYLFILGGIIYSLYSISMTGVLLEVSGTSNRALYTGFAGAGNIFPAIFPLIGGVIINHFGYQSFFIMFIVVISTTFYFIYKIDCKK